MTVIGIMRTNREAHLYLDLHPCQCGSARYDRRSDVVEIDGRLCVVYSCDCHDCKAQRECAFELPEEPTVQIDPVRGQFGLAAGRSELLDPGEWITVADKLAAAASATQPEALQLLGQAIAAIAEVRMFCDDTIAGVPQSAMRSTVGKHIYATEPGRFDAPRLAVVQNAYEDYYRNQLGGALSQSEGPIQQER